MCTTYTTPPNKKPRTDEWESAESMLLHMTKIAYRKVCKQDPEDMDWSKYIITPESFIDNFVPVHDQKTDEKTSFVQAILEDLKNQGWTDVTQMNRIATFKWLKRC